MHFVLLIKDWWYLSLLFQRHPSHDRLLLLSLIPLREAEQVSLLKVYMSLSTHIHELFPELIQHRVRIPWMVSCKYLQAQVFSLYRLLVSVQDKFPSMSRTFRMVPATKG